LSIVYLFTIITFDLSNNKNTHKMKNSNDLIKAFKVFKNGTTENWVTILIPINEFNSEVLKFKIEKYLYLGYQVENI